MIEHNYTRRHNEVLRCIYLLLTNKYSFKKTKNYDLTQSQEGMKNEKAEIRIDTMIRPDILVKNNRLNIFIYDKRENKIILVEVGITRHGNLQIIETRRKGNLTFCRMN
ncbi:hypothetical protein TCON_2526 [Astathelohania contejeani]|uniref:Uncharacterized protein n=1 Tax=Astathelohania contejeani TaxID=164912 RepID=A0ABQ7HVT6_9MICR|nr:hypothetical protein TCON_2526 [Thelohania contejeani]